MRFLASMLASLHELQTLRPPDQEEDKAHRYAMELYRDAGWRIQKLTSRVVASIAKAAEC